MEPDARGELPFAIYSPQRTPDRLPSLFFHHTCVQERLGTSSLQEPSGTIPLHSTTTLHTGWAKATDQLKRRRKSARKTNPASEGRGLLLLDKQNLPYTGTKMSTFNNICPPFPLAPRKARESGLGRRKDITLVTSQHALSVLPPATATTGLAIQPEGRW